jgi:hypothetical protein
MRIPFFSPHTATTEGRPDEINLLAPDLWDGVSDGVQCELLRQAEMMVKATVTVATGPDTGPATQVFKS